jgi:hypothetical protein
MKKIQIGGHVKGSIIRGFALVDDTDFENINKFKWSDDGHGYARKRKGGIISMAKMILGNLSGKEIDHINGNKLDNRRINLRFASKSENAMNVSKHSHNTSGFKGVSFHKRIQKFQTRIRINNQLINLGYFENAKRAAEIYNVAAIKYHKGFAKLNII